VVSLAVVALASVNALAQPAEPEPPPAEPADPCDGGEVVPPPAEQAEPSPPSPPPPQLQQQVAPTPIAAPPPHHPEPMVARSFDRGDEGFRFGSYGRVLAGSDLRGGKPEPVTVVGHGPRIVEKSYLELDLQYKIYGKRGRAARTVTTLAFDDTLFHDTGEFDARPALRNFYLDVDLTDRLSAWGGSRMYRGNDIYLFDYWPLDDQNTVGAGARYRGGKYDDEPWFVSAHVGWNRLLDDFQFQEIAVPDPEQGATTVTQLNRQRTVASATFEYEIVPNGAADLNLTGKLHGEFQALPSGTRERMDGTLEALPRDTGYTIGAELIAFGMAPSRFGYKRHANLFARYSRGLAAFDELAPPTSFDSELKTTRASEFVVGLSSNWDHALGHVLFGALTRRVVDADRNEQDVDDGWEYAIDVRPLVRATRDLYAGVDLSYQVRFPRGLNPTSQRASDPAIAMIAPMLVWSPIGGSGYDRPQLRAVYRAARLNDGARDLYAPDDPRRDRTWVHFLGIQAEWWFNSASYR
jgi:maltoporin